MWWSCCCFCVCVWIWFALWCHWPSTWPSSISISYKAGLLAMNFSVFISECPISSSFMKTVLPNKRFMTDSFLSTPAHCRLSSSFSDQKSAVSIIRIPLGWMSHFFSFPFQEFLLPLSFRILAVTVMCLGVALVPFILWCIELVKYAVVFFVCLIFFFTRFGEF